jgi:hypothetical protein
MDRGLKIDDVEGCWLKSLLEVLNAFPGVSPVGRLTLSAVEGLTVDSMSKMPLLFIQTII